jgi:small-conductance mechanosensitive channel
VFSQDNKGTKIVVDTNKLLTVYRSKTSFVLQTSLDDFYVSYEINVCTKAPVQQPLIYSKLEQNIQDCFNEDGLEIMSPHFNALRDGNKGTTPDDYPVKNYKAPLFNVNSSK